MILGRDENERTEIIRPCCKPRDKSRPSDGCVVWDGILG